MQSVVAFRRLTLSRRWTTRVALYSLLCAAALFSIAFSGPPPAHAETTRSTEPSSKNAEYVGSESCAGCHATEHADWGKSHHKAAMQVATAATVLGNFNGATFEKHGTESVFFKRDGKFWVRTDGPDGKLDDFEILDTFGVAPLQQYLIGLPGGRLQAFGIAWDARPASDGGQRWYHLYPDRKLAAGDPLHWTGIDQNWNYQCAFCHSTNLQKNYDAATTQFKTTWSEISVGCEACHGPGSRHLDWATKTVDGKRVDDPGKGFAFTLDERRGVSWRTGLDGYLSRSKPRTEDKVVHVCAACHSRRQQFSSDPRAVAKFLMPSGRHCSLRTSIIPTASNAMRCIITAPSCRVACTLPVSPAPTAITRTRALCDTKSMQLAPSAMRPNVSMLRPTTIMKRNPKAQNARRATCPRPPIWVSTRAMIIRSASPDRTARSHSAHRMPALNATRIRPQSGPAMPSRRVPVAKARCTRFRRSIR